MRNHAILHSFFKKSGSMLKPAGGLFCLMLVVLLFTGQALARGVLRLATFDTPPKEYLDDGEPVGLNIDILNEAFRRLDIEISIEFFPLQRCLVMAKKGAVDGVFAIVRTPEREKYLTFPATPLYECDFYLFKLKDRNISLAQDYSNANKYTLGTAHGFNYNDEINSAIAQGRFKRVEPVWDIRQNMVKLLAGRVDMVLEDKVTVLHYLKEMNSEDKADTVMAANGNTPFVAGTNKTYLAFSKYTISPELVEKFSTVLKDMLQDGTIKKYEEKYLVPENSNMLEHRSE